MSIRPIILWLSVVVSLLAVTDARASWWHVGAVHPELTGVTDTTAGQAAPLASVA